MNKNSLNKLKNAEYLLFMKQIEALIAEANHEKISPLNGEFKTLLEKFEEGQKQVRKSEHTNELVLINKKRDRLYNALKYRLESEKRCISEDRNEAANLLLIVVKSYGNPTRLNLIQQTSVINQFISELRQPKYAEAIRKTGLGEFVSALEQANQAFLTKHEERRDTTAEQVSIDVKAVRKSLDEQYYKINTRIQALMELEPTDELTTLVNKMNATIDKYKTLV